ncbi:Galactose mutarotase-like superfamily protein [Euphorbia peplus]|nr:Galactose mutarotase-like superfamily protein [Euphorbia peplus]
MGRICLCILIALLLGYENGIAHEKEHEQHKQQPKHHAAPSNPHEKEHEQHKQPQHHAPPNPQHKSKQTKHHKEEDISKKKHSFFTLHNGNVTLKFTNLGAAMVSYMIPDARGNPIDIILGYDTLEEYKNDKHYIGAIVGRVSNRIKNAEYKLNETVYKLVPNLGKDIFHGGPVGFSKVLWRVTSFKNKGPHPYIVFTYHSPDGDQGFPGKLVVSVMYSLTGKHDLTVVMKAKNVDCKPSPVSMAQHNYWNIGGQDTGNILSESVQIFAEKYTPVGPDNLPVGLIYPVTNTLFDFRVPEIMGIRIAQLPTGYDINYALDEPHGGKKMRRAVHISDSRSGLQMDLYTDAPGMQFYTGNSLNNTKGKGGFLYQPTAGLCLQTQHFPNFVNQPTFPQSIVHPGETYRHHMLFKFSYQ